MQQDSTSFPKQYPAEYPTSPPKPGKLTEIKEISKELNAQRKYSFLSLVLLFFVFSFFGWCWEVLLFLLKDGTLINRGTMFGPWLPIYGSGALLILIFLRRWVNRPILTFFVVMFVCCVLEYFTSWSLEFFTGMRWWDYSGFFLNLHGRIYLLGALTFATGGSACIYFLGPKLDNLLRRIPRTSKICLCIVLVCLFTFDLAYSRKYPNTGEGVTENGAKPCYFSADKLPDRW